MDSSQIGILLFAAPVALLYLAFVALSLKVVFIDKKSEDHARWKTAAIIFGPLLAFAAGYAILGFSGMMVSIILAEGLVIPICFAQSEFKKQHV